MRNPKIYVFCNGKPFKQSTLLKNHASIYTWSKYFMLAELNRATGRVKETCDDVE
jgi:hypothetical protein